MGNTHTYMHALARGAKLVHISLSSLWCNIEYRRGQWTFHSCIEYRSGQWTFHSCIEYKSGQWTFPSCTEYLLALNIEVVSEPFLLALVVCTACTPMKAPSTARGLTFLYSMHLCPIQLAVNYGCFAHTNTFFSHPLLPAMRRKTVKGVVSCELIHGGPVMEEVPSGRIVGTAPCGSNNEKDGDCSAISSCNASEISSKRTGKKRRRQSKGELEEKRTKLQEQDQDS